MKFKLLFSIILIGICGYTFYQIINNNISSKKIDYQIQSSTSKLDNLIDNLSEKNTNPLQKSLPIDKSDNNSTELKNDEYTHDEFSVLVNSPDYNAIVSLDDSSKEFKISLLEDDSTNNKTNTSHYINLTQDNVDYLIENKDSLISKFKEGGIFDKYNLVSDMLKSYDTNIKMEDLITVGLKYLNK